MSVRFRRPHCRAASPRRQGPESDDRRSPFQMRRHRRFRAGSRSQTHIIRQTTLTSLLSGRARAHRNSLSCRRMRRPSNSRPIGTSHDPGVKGVSSAKSPSRMRTIPTVCLAIFFIRTLTSSKHPTCTAASFDAPLYNVMHTPGPWPTRRIGVRVWYGWTACDASAVSTTVETVGNLQRRTTDIVVVGLMVVPQQPEIDLVSRGPGTEHSQIVSPFRGLPGRELQTAVPGELVLCDRAPEPEVIGPILVRCMAAPGPNRRDNIGRTIRSASTE